MKIYLDKNLGVTNVEQEELTQDTIGYNILKVYIPNAALTPYNTFTCYYGALLQNGRKVGWFSMEARTSTDADYEENYTLYKATLEQCVVSVEGKVYIGCQVLLGNSGNATLIKKNTAVVQFNVRKSVAINNDILVLDTDQTTTDVLESYKNLLENALTTYATKAEVYTKAQVDALLLQKADKSDTYNKTEVDVKDLNLAAQMASDKLELNNRINTTNNILVETNAKVASLETDVDTLQNNTYSKTEVDEKIDDISAYTKSEIDTMINAKADKTTVEGINTRVGALENDIADLKSVQNVVEVVATKSALNSYDTTKLDANDKVQVIADETHGGASTIYNWNGSAWQYVGAFGGNSYTKAETYNKTQIDSALSDKADKSNTYTRAVIDSMVLTLSTDKADKSNTYTKTEIDNTMQEVGEIVETLGKEVEKKANAEYISKGTTLTQTSYSNTNPSKSTKVVLSKVGGMSYKSENLLALEDVAETTTNGLTYKVENGVISVSGTTTSGINLWVNLKTTLAENTDYVINFFHKGTHEGNVIYNVARQRSDWTNRVYATENPSFTFNVAYTIKAICLQFDNGGTYNCTFKPMVITGTISPTTYKPYGILDSAVTAIRSKNGSTIVNSLSIPSYIRNIEGYGWGINDTCYNYIDFERKVFVQKVSRVDLGSLNWIASKIGSSTDYRMMAPDLSSVIALSSSDSVSANISCPKYKTLSANSTYLKNTGISVDSSGNVAVYDEKYNQSTSTSAFKNAMNGVYMIYELVTPVETDISAYLTTDTLECIEGGTLEFLNTYNQAVPNEIAYLFNAVTLNNIVDSNGNTNVIATKQELNEKSKVVANPTLSGNEATLEGAEIDGIKYKVGGGGKLYMHCITIQHSSDFTYFTLYTSSQTAFTISTLIEHIKNKYINACGYFYLQGTGYPVAIIKSTPSNEFIVFQNLYDGKTITFSTGVTIIDTISEV